MKTTITSELVRNAVEYVAHADRALSNSRIIEVARASMGAHLMIAIALEGLANQLGAQVYDAWTWKKLERVETPLKWRLLSEIGGRKPFDQGEEPLQTVSRLVATRNELAHPKMQDVGEEVIVVSKAGNIARNVDDEYQIEDGDDVILGGNKVLDRFTAEAARDEVRKALAAMRLLRDHLNVPRLGWIESLQAELEGTVAKIGSCQRASD